MADYFYSREARLDLLEIWEHIAKTMWTPPTVWRRRFEKPVTMLAANPGLGHLRRDLTSKPVRFWPVYSYLVIYDPAARPLEVVCILSGYRDVAAMLNRNDAVGK